MKQRFATFLVLFLGVIFGREMYGQCPVNLLFDLAQSPVINSPAWATAPGGVGTTSGNPIFVSCESEIDLYLFGSLAPGGAVFTATDPNSDPVVLCSSRPVDCVGGVITVVVNADDDDGYRNDVTISPFLFFEVTGPTFGVIPSEEVKTSAGASCPMSVAVLGVEVNGGPYPSGASFTVGGLSFNTPPTESNTCFVTYDVLDIGFPFMPTCGGSLFIEWEAKDACDRTATIMQEFVLEDDSAPLFLTDPMDMTINISDCTDDCPLDLVTEYDGSVFPLAVPFGDDFFLGCTEIYEAPRMDQVNDVCGNNVSLQLLSVVHGTNSCNKTITFTWQLSDDCGNTDSRTQVFTIVDDVVPVITPTLMTTFNVSCDVAVVEPTANDVCQGVLPVIEGTPNTLSIAGLYFSDNINLSVTCENESTVIRTWVAADGCGNLSTSFVQTINYTDNMGPTFTAPLDVVTSQGLDCSTDDDFDPQFLNSLSADFGFPKLVMDNCQDPESSISANFNGTNSWVTAGGYTIEYNDNIPCTDPDYCTVSGGYTLRYKIERTWTITDACLETSAPVVQTINITDNQPPNITGTSNLGTININGVGQSCPHDVAGFLLFSNDPDPASTFHYDGTNLIVNDPSTGALLGTFAPPTATDVCNGIGSTVCPNDATLAIRGISTNNKDNAPCNVRYSVLWEASDLCGNTTPLGTPFTQLITFSDQVAPQWTLLAGSLDQTLDCTNNIEPTILGNGGAGNFPMLSHLVEDCGILANYRETLMVPPANSLQGIYFLDGTISNCTANEKTLIRTWYAVDTCGNVSAPFDQEITIEDNSTPSFVAPTSPITLLTSTLNDCPDGSDPEGMVNLTEGQVVTAGASFTVAGASFNAPVYSIAPANPGEFGGVCDASSVLTLDELNVIGTNADCEFNLELVWKVTDECANEISRTQVFTIKDDSAPTHTNPGAMSHVIDSGLDACPLDFDEDDFSYDPITNEIVITDPVSGKVTRNGNVPIFTENCQSNVTVSLGFSVVSLNNCNAEHLLTWTASDGCGNSTLPYFQNIEISESVKPINGNLSSDDSGSACAQIADASFFNYNYYPLTGLGALTYDDGTGVLNLTGVGAANFEENCGLAEVALVGAPSLVSQNLCDAIYSLTYSAIDSCNNSTSIVEQHIQTITIEDTEGPSFTSFPPDDATLECVPDSTYYLHLIAAVDNCVGTPVNLILVTDVVTNAGSGCGLDPIVIERTYSIQDVCGNITAQTQNLVISDNVDPVFTDTLADITICPGITVPDYSQIVANDGVNCISSLTFSSTDNIIQEGTGCIGDPRITERTFRVEDACGNYSEFVQTITEIDDEAPTFTPPADTFFYYNELCVTSPTITSPTNVSDNCRFTSVSFGDAFDVDPVNQGFIINRTWEVTDGCFTVSHTQVIGSIDTISPTIIIDSEIVECSDGDLEQWLESPIVSDNCNSVTSDYNFLGFVPTCGNRGIYTYEFFAIDDAGNTSAPVTRTYEIRDISPPSFDNTNLSPNITINCGESTEPLDLSGLLTITDACDTIPHLEYVDSRAFPGCPDFLEIITRTWTATDHCGNEATFIQTINIEDIIKPSITCPDNITIACTDTPSYSFTGQALSTDDCQGILIPTFNDVEVVTDCIKTITRTWTTTDDCGNSNSCEQEIILEDNKLPEVLQEPVSLTVECDGNDNITQRFDWLDNNGGAVVIDDCGTVDISYILQSSNSKMPSQCEKCYPYEFWAKDGCNLDSVLVGNASFCIVDTTPPVFDSLATDLVVECDGNGNTIELFAWLDNNGGARATETCSKVFWNYQNLNSSFNCAATFSMTYQFSAKDSCGYEILTTAEFIILDTKVPSWAYIPLDTIVQCDGTGNKNELAAWINKWTSDTMAMDDCGAVMITTDLIETINPDTCFGQAFYKYEFTAEDECGNKSSRIASFRVLDEVEPTINCPKDTVVFCSDDISPSMLGSATGFDACSFTNSASFVDSLELKPCPNVENIYRKWTVMDACGNSANCQQLIERQDTIKPHFTFTPVSVVNEYITDAFGGCHKNFKYVSADNPNGNCWEATFDVLDAGGNNLGSLVFPGPCVEDDCSMVTPTLTVNQITGDQCFRTWGMLWAFEDNCGNKVEFTQTINVYDQAVPQWTVPNPYIINAVCTDDVTDLIADNIPTIEDNCGGIVTEKQRDVIDAGCVKTHIITYETMDSCGNLNPTLLQVHIDVSDKDDPIWTASLPPIDSLVECDGAGNTGQMTGWIALWEDVNNATDNCGDVELEADLKNYQQGSCPETGVWIYEFIATDDCGNSSIQTGTFAIQDTTKPVINFCPPTAMVDCGESIGPGALGWAAATDNCNSLTNLVYNDASSTGICPAPIETVTRTWIAMDACGNINTCEQMIQIIDNEDPEIINGADHELIALTSLNGVCNGISTGAGTPGIHVDFAGADGSQCSKVVFNGYDTNGDLFQSWNIDGPCAIDDCAGVSFAAAITPSINGCLTLFEVVWTVSDACGNEVQDTQVISFRDGVTPTWNASTSVVVNTDCSEPIAEVIIKNRPTALDNCAVIYNTISDVITNQGTCSGKYTRTITYSISDDCGNTNPTTAVLVVNVNDTIPPVFTTAPRDTTFACGTPNILGKIADWSNNFGGATVSDYCGNATLTAELDYVIDLCGGADEFKYWFIATDDCGNADTLTAFFRTIDTIAPIITIQPQNMTVDCDGLGNITALNNWLANGAGAQAVDECWYKIDWDHRLVTTNATSCSEAESTYEIIALDDCGNSDTTTAIFTVVDTFPPIFVNPPADITISCSANVPPAATVTAVDCDANLGMSMTETITPVNAGGIKELITRVWVAVDCHNRVSTHTQVITVQTGTGPATLYCPIDPGPFLSQNGGCVIVNWTEPVFSGSNVTVTSTHKSGDCFDIGNTTVIYTATDNCGGTTICSFNVEITDFCAPVTNTNTQNYIEQIGMNTINNVSGNDNGYGNYKNLSTTLFTGTNYFMSLNPGGPGGTGINAAGFWRVWIDWNGDGLFSEPSERVAQAAGQGLMIANINIPSNPTLGSKCMRVSFGHFNYPQPCETYVNGFGEVEDYTIHVIPPLLLVDNPNNEKEAISDEKISFDKYGFVANLKGKMVDLNWSVMDNFSIDYFNIERSKDGVEFHKILTINNLENSSGELYYKAKDKKPLAGTNYYRLIQVLKNGVQVVSEVQKVIVEQQLFTVELYPNPTDGNLYIRQSDFVGKKVAVSISNNLAQLVHDFKFEKMEPTTVLDLSNLPNGVYNVIIKSGDFVTVKQVILQR